MFWEPIIWLSVFLDGGYQTVESDLAARPAECRLRLAVMAGIDYAPDQIPHHRGWVLICISQHEFPVGGSGSRIGASFEKHHPLEADDLPEVTLLDVSG